MDKLQVRCIENDVPSGVWNMVPLPNSSLVGLALGCPPGRGEAGARVGVPRADGPIDWRAIDLPFSYTGDGLGLVEGGRRLIVCKKRLWEEVGVNEKLVL